MNAYVLTSITRGGQASWPFGVIFHSLLAVAIATAAEAPVVVPEISAHAAIVVSADTGLKLWGHHENERRAMASTTKIMTALIAIERGNLNDVVMVGVYPTMVGGSGVLAGRPAVYTVLDAIRTDSGMVPLQAGERVRLLDLLYGMMLVSGNNAAQAIAEHNIGRRSGNAQEGLAINDEFARLMNQRAQAADLNLTNTSFRSPHGRDPIDVPGLCGVGLGGINCGHYSTANDLAKLARIALRNPTFAAIVKAQTWSFESLIYDPFLPVPGFKKKIYSSAVSGLKNTNQLLFDFAGTTGVKTGTTDHAGACLVASAALAGKSLISVVLNSETVPGDRDDLRFKDSTRLLDYGFDRLMAVRRTGDSAAQAGTVDRIEIVSNSADRFVTAVRDASGDLKLNTWSVQPDNSITRLHDSGSLAGTISEVALDALSATKVVTAVRDSRGNLKLITWQIDTAGRITRPNNNGTGGISGTQMALKAISDRMIVTAMRDGSGILRVTSWSLNLDGSWTQIHLAYGNDEADRLALTTYCVNCGFSGNDPPTHRVVAAVFKPGISNSNLVKLIVWDIDNLGMLTRRSMSGIAALWGDDIALDYDRVYGTVITAGRNVFGHLQLISWRITANGTTIQRKFDTLTEAGAPVGLATRIRAVGFSGGGLVTAFRDGAGNLKIVVWGVDQNGKLRRVDDSDSQVGGVSLVSLAANSRRGYVTAVKANEGTLKLINWRIE